jgi:WD40 repeat protein
VLIRSIPAPKEVRYAALGPERTLLAISDGTTRTVIVNALTGEGRHVLDQPSAVTSLRFGPAARTLAVGGSDGSVRLWRVSTGEHRATLRFGHVGRITDIAFSPRATLVATASADGTARVWRVGSAQPVSVLPAHENVVNDVDFSRDGSFVVTAGKDGTARTWRATNGESLATLRGHGDSVAAATFLPSGDRVVTAGADDTIRLWNVVRQPKLRVVRSFSKPVERVRFAGHEIEATVDGRIHVLEASGQELRQRGSGTEPVERAPDGARVTIKGKTAIVHRPDGRELVLGGHRDALTSARFSPDGRLVVTASRDSDAIVWDARRGTLRRKLLGHFSVVSDARFSPDGRWIITAGPGKAGLWDASTGALVYFLQGHKGKLLSAAFDRTSRVVVTGGVDGTVRTWRCDICGRVDELVPVARARLAAIAGD